jgi:hypothetical protein
MVSKLKVKVIKTTTGLAVAMLVMIFGGSSVMAEVGPDSTTWENTYEADQTPVAAGWTNVWDYDDIATVVADPCDPCNNYIQVVGSGDEYAGFRQTLSASNFDQTTDGGISVEWRLSVTEGTYLMHIWPGQFPTRRWLTVYVSPDSVIMGSNDQNHVSSGAFEESFGDPNGFHTYRVTCDDTDWNLYRYRNSEAPVYSAWLTTPVEASDATSTSITVVGIEGNTTFDLDYIRWTNEGSLLVAPPSQCGEPGTEYRAMDINLDCYVNFGDFALFASEWLECTDPTDEACD